MSEGMFAELGTALRALRESAGLTTPILDDPAFETLRTAFGHLLKTFEILIASRYIKETGLSDQEV